MTLSGIDLARRAHQRSAIVEGQGFIAALDQSGGSTPKALAAYGVDETQWASPDEMFDLVHQMRARLITSRAFASGRVIGAILFEQTMDRTVDGQPTATYLWDKLGIVPFVKSDAGLADRSDDVQLLAPNPGLGALLERANAAGIYGTKMRSVIHAANAGGIEQIVGQQFEVASTILDTGLMPIIEPEVSIDAPDKAEAEILLADSLLRHLDDLGERSVMFKLTLPEDPDLYRRFVEHRRVDRVVALSGGYGLVESCDRLRHAYGMTASFSRVLMTGLTADLDDDLFEQRLEDTVAAIHEASVA
ncbi:MAG: fructose bisphosphate aldolase [Actinomycetota bacterium]